MKLHKEPKGNISIATGQATYDEIRKYFENIKSLGLDNALAKNIIGRRLFEVLKDSDISKMSVDDFMDAMLKTAKPLLFAEKLDIQSETPPPWTEKEIILMGQLVKVVEDVTVYSKSTLGPTEEDFLSTEQKTTMLFANGALLKGCAADAERVLTKGEFDVQKYEKFVEENVLPALLYANQAAQKNGAVITLPLLGAGEFAGTYQKDIKMNFPQVLAKVINKNKANLGNVKSVIVTGLPPQNLKIGSINFQTTLYPIGLYPQEEYPETSKYQLFSIVAGDHLSFPGNDFYQGSPSTHEGGNTAVTNLLEKITFGLFKGIFNKAKMMFQNPEDKSGEDICSENKISLSVNKITLFKDGKGKTHEYVGSQAYDPVYLDAKAEANYLKATFGELEQRGSFGIRVRATLGAVLKEVTPNASKEETLEVNISANYIHIISNKNDGCLNHFSQEIPQNNGNRFEIKIPLNEGLALLNEALLPYKKEFTKALHGQDPIEHLLLIGLEEFLTPEFGANKIKPFFNNQGELIFIHKNKEIKGVEAIMNYAQDNSNLTKLSELPLFENLKLLEQEKKGEYQNDNDQIQKWKTEIYNTKWKVISWGIEKTVCLADGDKITALPTTVQSQLAKIEEYEKTPTQSKNPKQTLAALDDLGQKASVETATLGTRNIETQRYYKNFAKELREAHQEPNQQKDASISFTNNNS